MSSYKDYRKKKEQELRQKAKKLVQSEYHHGRDESNLYSESPWLLSHFCPLL